MLKIEKFDFKINDLYYGTIENVVTNYYKIGYPSSSNFIELEVGSNNDCIIDASDGFIIFSAIVGKNISNEYFVSVYPKILRRW